VTGRFSIAAGWTAMVMLALTVLLIAARLHGYSEPLERDVTTYAVVGQELLHGRQLYTDLWEHKPPAVYLTFAAARLLTSSPRAAVFLANATASIVALLGVFVAGSAGRHGRIGGLYSAVVWLAVSGDLWLQGNQPNTEIFINACLVWAFAIVVMAMTRGLSTRALAVAGSLLAIATLYKQIAAVVVAALVCACGVGLWIGSRESTPTRARLAGGLQSWLPLFAAATGPSAIAWLLTLLYFARQARLGDFVSAVFVYNRSYAGQLQENLTAVWGLLGAVPEGALLLLGTLLLVAAIGCVVDGINHPVRWLALGAYLAAAAVMVVLPGRLYPHYFLLLLPPLAVASGWTVAALSCSARSTARVVGISLGLITITVLLWHEIPSYRLSPEQWSRLKYGSVFVDSQRLGESLDRLLPPSATFYHVGAETGLYFASGRRPPTGVFYDYPLLSGPLRDVLARRVVADLEADPPALVVQRVGRPVHPLVRAWVEENYELGWKADLPTEYAILQRKH